MSLSSRKRIRTTGSSYSGYLDPESPELDPDFSPRMNRYEYTDSNMVTTTFELPGLNPGDVTISLLHNKLTISGESADQRPGEGKYSIREIPYGKWSRVLTVSLGVRPEDFKARMENGLLTLSFPKDPPKQEPHRIPIQ